MIDSIIKWFLKLTEKKEVVREEFTTPKIPVVQCHHEFRKAIATLMVNHRNLMHDEMGVRSHVQIELAHKLIDELMKNGAIEFREETMTGRFENRFVAIIKYIK